ncbi:ATP-dependent helicase [Gilvimarinus sp. F26214L]|uniref:ATP-dependent helicase n=1 Tax=Gilvimarinus sp. DZF01 TaxID=3461371 RepID=UPI0040464A26
MQALNKQQQQAVEFGRTETGKGLVSGPLLIIAGAGTGKTNTLAHRAAHLILSGVSPGRILLMTFSRRAAQELADRARRIVTATLQESGESGEAEQDLSWIGTFHSVANRLLRTQAKTLGLDPDFTIMDRGDAADMLDLLRHKLGFSRTAKRFPHKGTCVDIYSRCVNAQAELKDVLERDFPWCADWEDELKKLFRAYVEEKQQQVCLDYDDLLLYWYHLAGEASVARRIREQFDHVLVDEYQDTNILQAGILTRLFPDGRGLTVVGDDAQSIYSFRSANVENILNFPALFSPPATVIPLSKNYRSTQPILDLSNALLRDASTGYKNQLFSDKPAREKPWLVTMEDQDVQSRYIIEKVLAAREEGIDLKQQAVLFRSSHHSSHLEVSLRRHNIPYVKHGGLKFLDAAHVKDAISILRWADNPRHRLSGFRILKLLPGIGPAMAEKVLDFMALHNFDPAALGNFKSKVTEEPGWLELVTLLRSVHHHQIPWREQMKAVADWYRGILEERYDNHFVRAGDIDQLSLIAQQYPNRERFLSELTLDPPNKTGDHGKDNLKDDDYLILSTVHSAKGQEWHKVFVLNVVDGNFPNEYATQSQDALEEERRLFNVAITRAQRELHLLQPLKFWIPEQQRFGGRHVYGAKSRFLTPAVVETLDEIPYPDTRLTEQDIATGEEVLADIKSKVLGMWD